MVFLQTTTNAIAQPPIPQDLPVPKSVTAGGALSKAASTQLIETAATFMLFGIQGMKR